MPMLHNYSTRGRSWQEHGIVAGQVLARNAHIADGSQTLGEYTQAFVADAVEKGWLAGA
jgi:putative hydrolase of HD superfamily